MRSFSILFAMELRKFRQAWIWSLLLSSLFPLSLLFFLRFGQGGSTVSVYTISGLLVYNLVLNTMLVLCQELSQIREGGSLDFYASLPIPKLALLAAIVARSMTFTLPSLAILAAVAFRVFTMPPLANLLWLAPVLALSALSLAGFGAWLGLAIPNARMASITSQALNVLIVFCSPIMIPEQSLPRGLVLVSRLFPTTYAAQALRAILSPAQLTPDFFRALAVTGAFAGVSLFVAARKLEWRAR